MILTTVTTGASNGTTLDWLMPLLQFGGVGVCLIWFMFRSEPRLRAIESSIDRICRALIVLSIAIANALEAMKWHAAESIKLQAHPIERELDDAAEKRK